MYELGLDPERFGEPMGAFVSLGVHESQSRLWENFVCRSVGFWRRFHPELQRLSPRLKALALDDFLFAVNQARPGLIRIEADEVTYNLHIILRFELERELARGALAPADLPDAWAAKSQAYLGLTPPDAARGAMQDVHWAAGLLGYFPTYALGNLYAAQFFAAAERDLGDLQAMFSRGEFSPLLGWLRTRIHSQGMRHRADELVREVTGQPLEPDHLVAYLGKKYGELYGL